MNLAADQTGNPAYPGILGIGAFNTGAAFTPGGDIDLSGSPEIANEFAFHVPRGGAMTDLAARFYMTDPLDLTGTTGTVTVQLYKSGADSEVFKEIAGVTLEPELDPAGSPYPSGTVLSVAANNLKAQVESGARLLLAFKAHSEGENPEITLTGYANASIGIF